MDNVNMDAIRAALSLRQQGSLGAGGVPMSQQQTPQAPTAPVTPLAPTGAAPQMPQGQAAAAGPLQAGQKAQSPMFDDETRGLAKSLVQKLLKGL